MGTIDKIKQIGKSLLGAVTGNDGIQSDKLYELIFDLWENQSANLAEKFKTNYSYWKGDYKPEYEKLRDQTTTACNVIKRIIEVKGSTALDAQFTMNIVPVLNSFASYDQLQDMYDYADILNSGVHEVLKDNDFDSLKEIQMRRGQICGIAPSQTTWEIDEDVEGKIKISGIDPAYFRWDKNAKPNDCTWKGYQIELNPMLVKKRYAKNPDGTYDDELVAKIDQLAEDKSLDTKRKEKGVVNVSNSLGGSQAYVYDTSGLQSGKIVKLIVMFIMDDSVYAPTENDDDETEAVKLEGQQKYPNGRMIVFSPDQEKKLIFDDRPAPAGFKSIGNIDEFRPIPNGLMDGENEVNDLIPIQDRINGAYAKLRLLVGEHIATFLFPDEYKGVVKSGSMVANAITFIRNINILGPEKKPQFITNNNIEEAMKLLALIERYEQESYRTGHINETMISGVQPEGVRSGDQLDSLKESPMTSIRSLQRNFKNYCTGIGEKIVTLMQTRYTVQRLIALSTGMNTDNGKADYAKFGQQGEKRVVELMNRAGQVCKTIKINPDWQFKCEVTSGTEIPRSRRETAALTEKVIDLMKEVTDMQLARQKQKEQSSKKYTIQDIILNPVLSKNLSDVITSLDKAGMTADIALILQNLGLSGAIDNAQTTPLADISSKADLKDVLATTAGKVSNNQEKDQQGREIAGTIIDRALEKGNEKIHI